MATGTRPKSRIKQIPRAEALKRLAAKDVSPAYRAPRGNQDLDHDALAVSVGASERLLTH